MTVVAWALPAGAQDDPAASGLRQLVEDWLTTMGGRTGGPVTVQRDGDGLTATLPDLALEMPQQGTVRFGTVTLTRRDAADGRHRYEGPLPRAIRIEEPTETSTVTIADGRFAIVVDPRTNTVHAYEGALTNLALESAPGQDAFTIAAIELSGGIAPRPDGLSDSPGRIRLQGVRADMPSSNQSFAVGELTLAGDLRGFTLADYERLRDATDAATRSSDMQEILRALEQWLSFGFATLRVDLTLADLLYRDGGATPAFAASRIAFGLDLESLAAPRTSYRLRYAHDGMAMRDDLSAIMAPYQGFAATAATLEIAVTGLPSEELRDTLASGMSSGAILADSFWTDAFDALLTSAIDNGASLRFGPFEMTAPLLGISGDATVTGNDRSPLQAIGSGEIVIRGLDEAARAVVDPSDPVGAIVAIISAIGQQGTDASGRPTRSYRIEADEQGRVMLNGNDLSALIGGGGGAAPPQQQPGTTPGK